MARGCSRGAAVAAQVEKFVLVSTDKAVNPDVGDGGHQASRGNGLPDAAGRAHRSSSSSASATCSAAQAASFRASREQIARGGPVTVTHPDITRFFMSISEATQLLLQAGLMGKEGEILALDMGEPVRILDLARDLIRLSGADPDRIADRVHRPAPGRKALRGVAGHRGGDAPDAASAPAPSPRRARPTADAVGQMVAWCERDRISDDGEVRARMQAGSRITPRPPAPRSSRFPPMRRRSRRRTAARASTPLGPVHTPIARCVAREKRPA